MKCEPYTLAAITTSSLGGICRCAVEVLRHRPTRALPHGEIVLAMRPAGDPAFDQREDRVKRDAHDGQDQKAGEDQRYLKVRARDHHDVADATVRCDGF